MSTSLQVALKGGAAELGLNLSEEQLARLLDYLALIAKWNRVYNLTAVRQPEEMLTHHLLDSLAIILPLRQQLARQSNDARSWRLLDVGAGAGLPGVVIALCCPEIAVTCVDTVAKKAAFIQQAAATLKLSNLRGLHARVESLRASEEGGFDVVCSRAFASLVDFTTWSRAALGPGAVWMAMKGRLPTEELAALPPSVQVFHVEPIQVPGLAAERCIIWMRPLPT